MLTLNGFLSSDYTYIFFVLFSFEALWCNTDFALISTFFNVAAYFSGIYTHRMMSRESNVSYLCLA